LTQVKSRSWTANVAGDEAKEIAAQRGHVAGQSVELVERKDANFTVFERDDIAEMAMIANPVDLTAHAITQHLLAAISR
jgi:hypothetical protein